MGALAAIVSKNGRNVVPEIIKMLSALRHRGSHLHGIATDKTTIIARDLLELSGLSRDVVSDIAIGHNFRRLLPEDNPQPVEIGNMKAILEGRVYSPPLGKSEVYRISEHYGEDGVRRVVAETEGSFVIALLSGKRIVIGRDAVGAAPLYFSENEQFIALASERKALWSIGARDEDIKSFPPGSMANITGKGITFRQIKAIEAPRVKPVRDEESILEALHTLLLEAVKRRLYGLEGRISVAFSGGLDSSVIAALLKRAHVDTLLVTVGLEGSRDLEHAEKVAREIGLRVRTETYTLRDVEGVLPRVLWLVEEANSLKVSIKIPEYWATEVSLKMGCRAIFFGEGGDELFGGYHKYLKEYKRSPEDAEMALFLDIINLYRSLEISEKICAFHGIEAMFPYADYELITFALKIPIPMKISSADDPLRKRILRRYAEYTGLPAEVHLRPKRAIQYGTGVSKALKKIAKRSGLSIQAFINKVFKEIQVSGASDINLLS
ncbi:MAG: asparagine synthetase B [Candidatus Bathyarchaeia archaeon]